MLIVSYNVNESHGMRCGNNLKLNNLQKRLKRNGNGTDKCKELLSRELEYKK